MYGPLFRPARGILTFQRYQCNVIQHIEAATSIRTGGQRKHSPQLHSIADANSLEIETEEEV